MNIQEIIHQARFTVLLGKNGAGKSTLLRSISNGSMENIKYISPERGGNLKYDPNVDNNIASNDNWLRNKRQKNRFEQFREQSAAQFRNLEMLVLREIENVDEIRFNRQINFHTIAIDKINELLPAIKLVRSDRGFSITTKSGEKIPEDQISSGEAELIALAIEVLVFSRSDAKDKIILLDEPDVHMHPDLQQRFTLFVQDISEEKDIKVVIATHSTAIIGAFRQEADLQVIPISSRNQSAFAPFRRSEVVQDILPVFGVHPLSAAFNKTPVMLVEGEDDKRVIEQFVRSSGGRRSWAPCPVDTVSALNNWEQWINNVLPAIYDDARAFSLRDLDSSGQSEIEDVGIVTRIRLNCYAIENILLTDECLEKHSLDSKRFVDLLNRWVQQYPTHQSANDVAALIQNFDKRRTVKIKDLRNLIVALLGNAKPWEFIVGQLLANYHPSGSNTSEHSLGNYLGPKAVTVLFD